MIVDPVWTFGQFEQPEFIPIAFQDTEGIRQVSLSLHRSFLWGLSRKVGGTQECKVNDCIYTAIDAEKDNLSEGQYYFKARVDGKLMAQSPSFRILRSRPRVVPETRDLLEKFQVTTDGGVILFFSRPLNGTEVALFRLMQYRGPWRAFVPVFSFEIRPKSFLYEQRDPKGNHVVLTRTQIYVQVEELKSMPQEDLVNVFYQVDYRPISYIPLSTRLFRGPSMTKLKLTRFKALVSKAKSYLRGNWRWMIINFLIGASIFALKVFLAHAWFPLFILTQPTMAMIWTLRSSGSVSIWKRKNQIEN